MEGGVELLRVNPRQRAIFLRLLSKAFRLFTAIARRRRSGKQFTAYKLLLVLLKLCFLYCEPIVKMYT